MLDFDAFLSWCEKRFESIKVRGNEIQINSIYDPDQDDCKHKLWCNPSGESKNGTRENGVYHCWISGKKGTLVGLVMDVEGCSYEEACEILQIDDGFSKMEEQLEAFFASKKAEPVKETVIAPTKKILEMPEGVVKISSLPHWNWLRKDAEAYLRSRKMPVDWFYIGQKDQYRERIIIPYYDADGDLIYYNGRYIGTRDGISKYKGPDKEIGVGKGDVVYMPKWVPAGGDLFVTEGEFDAIALHLCGLGSAAVGGSHLTAHHLKVLKDYRIVLCADNDGPGINAVLRTGVRMLEEGFKGISFVRPPAGFKDWNELYIRVGELVSKYIGEKSKPFNVISAEQLFMNIS